MPFAPGHKKHPDSGRKLGQKNRKTILKAKDVLFDKSINPVEEILKLMPELKPSERLDAWKFLMNYIEPKVKEQSNDEDAEESSEETQNILEIIPKL